MPGRLAGLAVGRRADVSLDEHSASLAAARDAARARGDFAEADRLRDELVGLGLVVEDTAGRHAASVEADSRRCGHRLVTAR